jgi:ABC-type transport system involved in cytochrome c biogenesis permease subunit
MSRSLINPMFGKLKAVLSAGLLALVAVFGLAPSAAASQDLRDFEWSEEVLDTFGGLPVLSFGRVKPVDSMAGLSLLSTNGKRAVKVAGPEGDVVKLDSLQWMLDCFFFPKQAATYASFLVQNDATITDLGLAPKERRDWYSYQDLLPARDLLGQRYDQIRQIDPKQRSIVEKALVKLFIDVRTHESLFGTMLPFRSNYSTDGSPGLRDIYGSDTDVGLVDVLEKLGAVLELRRSSIPAGNGDYEGIQALMIEVDSGIRACFNSPDFMPPLASVEDQDTWWGIDDVIDHSFELAADFGPYLDVLRSVEALTASVNDPELFERDLDKLAVQLHAMAEPTGKVDTLGLEVTFNHLKPFFFSWLSFLFAFFAMALTWLLPKSKGLWKVTWTFAGIGPFLLVLGIVLRCVIRSRPPIISLYDTIVFICAVMVFVGFFAEWITRQRVALAMSIIAGIILVWIADLYEYKEVKTAGDTMGAVVAVLNTNFYLAVHVTSVSMGYSGGLLAGLLAHVWILGKFFGLKRGDKQFYQSLNKMIYGVAAFCLLFSIFGTVMGGVWGNDSWGRFWGWDVKENGALLICLWMLFSLHMRMGGFVRQRGFALLALFGGVVVSISWWGVNLLDVGLHSYGKTSGVATILFWFWMFEGLVLLIGIADGLREAGATAALKAAKEKPAS